KDNGIDTDKERSKPYGDLAKTLPVFDEDDGVVPFRVLEANPQETAKCHARDSPESIQAY
ncbi:MAG: hypothetical protein GY788_23470, partial [bacterium]|nr:hypothetical protein [bacterium]